VRLSLVFFKLGGGVPPALEFPITDAEQETKMPKIATQVESAEFDTAYWAPQPTPVQALHRLPDGVAARGSLAQQLASEGFIIGNAIIVWGWGPYYTMSPRIADKHIWTPAANQPPVLVAPGLELSGYPSYEPSIIPAGSCITTLDFDLLPLIFPVAAGVAA